MKRFISFITEEEKPKSKGNRTPMTHFKDLKHEDLVRLIGDGKIRGTATEKSDGMGHEIGFDQHGFYTQTSSSGKMRQPGDYYKSAVERFGPDADPNISNHFDRIHKELMGNKALFEYLRDRAGKKGETKLKGEMFYLPHGRPDENGGVRFVGTSYDPKKMGKTGKYIIHTKLPENQGHDFEALKKLGDENINFDDDAVENGKVNIDVNDERKAIQSVNPVLMASRKRSEADARAAEIGKLTAIKDSIEKKLRAHTGSLKPKWGKETEGHIIHPDDDTLPRFKLVSDTFKQNKPADLFKKKTDK